MIPLIALMIGSYIFVRMVSFILRKDTQSEHWIVKILAGLVGIAVIVCVIKIFQASTELSSLMQLEF